MAANSAVQHVASGLGATLGGMIVEGGAGEPLRHFGTVGWLAATVTIASLWLAPRIRPLALAGFFLLSLTTAPPFPPDAGTADLG